MTRAGQALISGPVWLRVGKDLQFEMIFLWPQAFTPAKRHSLGRIAPPVSHRAGRTLS